MNLRQVWTEIFQKPAGRLLLFLLIGGIFLAFILLRRGPQPKPDNTQVAHQATQAKSYSFDEDIPAPPRAQSTPAERTYDKAARATPTPKPPPPIPQTIFVTKEQSVSELFLPYGRLLRCELVNTVDSTNIDTPIIGLVIEDAWNDGRLIIPAGTEVHGVAQKSAVRERIGSDRQWFLVFQDGRELPVSGTVLDYAPDPKKPNAWNESDGSAGLRGFFVKSDKYAEAKAILACDDFRGSGCISSNDHPSFAAWRGNANQQRRDRKRLFRRAPGRRTDLLQASLGAARQEPVLRSRSGRCDLLPLHHANGGFRQSHGGTFRIARTLQQPQTAMKFLHSILLLSLVAGCATKKEVRSVQRVKVPSTSLAANNLPEVRTPETVKAYPLGRYTDPNFPEEMHERHTLYRREQSAEWNYRPSKPYALPLGPVIAQSNPSPSYYARTDSEQINAQQKAYAEALLEQNQVLKKRIDALQQKDSTIQNLQGEIERLKKELESRPSQQSAPPNGETPDPSSAKPDDFSKVNTLDFTDPSEIMLFPRSEADYQAFLISQMRLNDELSAELCALERRRFEVLFGPSSPSRSYLALTTHKNP